MAEYMERLARFVSDTRLQDLDPADIAAAKAVVLDTIGAILAGSLLTENRNLAQMASKTGGSGPSTILGNPVEVQAVFATLVNATAGVALEMDEGNRMGGGHPAIHVLPAALAVAEEVGARGRRFLEALIVGYEATSRIGSGVKVRPEVHSHGTWGTVGAAAATAKLLDFGPDMTCEAMNIACSMSPANTWTPCLEGATVRNLYPGRSGLQGIMAAQVAVCGFTGLQDGPADIYGSLLGQSFDAAAVVDGLDPSGPLRVRQNYFKLHACCLYNHPVLDGVQHLMDREEFAAGEVASIRVEAPPVASIMTNPEPDNMLAAKFSLPYAVATAVVHGATDVTAFYPDRVKDPETRALARRVNVVADPEMDLRRYDYPAARVSVSLHDGRTLTESVTVHHGDHRDPASRKELIDKFTFLTRDILGADGARKVVEAVEELDTLEDIRELTALLRVGEAGPDPL